MASVLVTGAGRGFGREVALVYASRGWTVFPLVRTPAAAESWAAEAVGAFHPIVADVAEDGAEPAIRDAVAGRTGSLDILVNNAGVIRKRRWLEETVLEDVEEAFRVHCVGALRCVRAALPFLAKSQRPTVVNVSSRFGSIHHAAGGGFRGIYSYSVAKCAQNMLSVCLDQELRPRGIRVLAVHPGRLRTEVAAADADTEPREAAERLADWLESLPREAPCGLHDLMGGTVIPW